MEQEAHSLTLHRYRYYMRYTYSLAGNYSQLLIHMISVHISPFLSQILRILHEYLTWQVKCMIIQQQQIDMNRKTFNLYIIIHVHPTPTKILSRGATYVISIVPPPGLFVLRTKYLRSRSRAKMTFADMQ